MANSQLPPTSQMDKARVGLLGKEAFPPKTRPTHLKNVVFHITDLNGFAVISVLF